jgi:23S rRNA pseudouridine2605 synthase
LIAAGRVRVDGRIVRDPESPTVLAAAIVVDDVRAVPATPVHLMLNKPRGLVTTRSDEQGRATVYDCFVGAELPWIAPVGRLDRASEGLLLFSNDPAFAAAITEPEHGIEKTYHVQVEGQVDHDVLGGLRPASQSKANSGVRRVPRCCAAERRTAGSRSCSTKGAIGRSGACSTRSVSRCCV